MDTDGSTAPIGYSRLQRTEWILTAQPEYHASRCSTALSGHYGLVSPDGGVTGPPHRLDTYGSNAPDELDGTTLPKPFATPEDTQSSKPHSSAPVVGKTFYPPATRKSKTENFLQTPCALTSLLKILRPTGLHRSLAHRPWEATELRFTQRLCQLQMGPWGATQRTFTSPHLVVHIELSCHPYRSDRPSSMLQRVPADEESPGGETGLR